MRSYTTKEEFESRHEASALHPGRHAHKHTYYVCTMYICPYIRNSDGPYHGRHTDSSGCTAVAIWPQASASSLSARSCSWSLAECGPCQSDAAPMSGRPPRFGIPNDGKIGFGAKIQARTTGNCGMREFGGVGGRRRASRERQFRRQTLLRARA